MKKIRVAINGYGRIGRSALRALYERHQKEVAIEIVAINGMGSLSVNAHLTRYDTTHGRFLKLVEISNGGLFIDKHYIQFFSEKEVKNLPWKALDVDVVYECTGHSSQGQAKAHLEAGAKKVLLASPFKAADATVVYGINHHSIKEEDRIISMASCTTNALAALIQPLIKAVGIQQGMMTTIHAYTSDQRLLDNHHSDLSRARAAAQSMIPTKTGATRAIGDIFPELKGKITGLALRVPVPNVSLLDFSFNALHASDAASINQLIQEEADTRLQGVLHYTDKPLVSSDFNHDTASAVLLTKETKVVGKLTKILAWYDNEWAFSNRMLDVTLHCFS